MSSPASPGATIFGPPLNPAKKCGSTNPVVIRRSAATHSRFSETGTSPTIPRSTSEAVVARVVVHHPPPGEHVWSEHLEPLALGARPVRAGRDEHDDVLVAHHAVEHLRQRRELQGARLWPRDVAHGDRDPLPGPDQLAKGRTGDGRVDRGPQRAERIGRRATGDGGARRWRRRGRRCRGCRSRTRSRPTGCRARSSAGVDPADVLERPDPLDRRPPPRRRRRGTPAARGTRPRRRAFPWR